MLSGPEEKSSSPVIDHSSFLTRYSSPVSIAGPPIGKTITSSPAKFSSKQLAQILLTLDNISKILYSFANPSFIGFFKSEALKELRISLEASVKELEKIRKNNSSRSSSPVEITPERIAQIEKILGQEYRGKKFLSGETYFTHTKRVAGEVMKLTSDEEVVYAAYLHKVSTEKEIRRILKGLGVDKFKTGRIIGYVRELVSIINLPYGLNYKDAVAINNRISLVMKLSETIQGLYLVLVDKFISISTYAGKKDLLEEIAGIYAPLAERLGLDELAGDFLDEVFRNYVSRTYNIIEKEIETVIGRSRPYAEKYLNDLSKEIRDGLAKDEMKVTVLSRVKKAITSWLKINRDDKKYTAIADLPDLLGLTVIVENEVDVYGAVWHIGKILKSKFNIDISANNIDKKDIKLEGGSVIYGQKCHIDFQDALSVKYEIQIYSQKTYKEMRLGKMAHWSHKLQKLDVLKNQKFEVIPGLAEAVNPAEIFSIISNYINKYKYINVINLGSNIKMPVVIKVLQCPLESKMNSIARSLNINESEISVCSIGKYFSDSQGDLSITCRLRRGGDYLINDGDLFIISDKNKKLIPQLILLSHNNKIFTKISFNPSPIKISSSPVTENKDKDISAFSFIPDKKALSKGLKSLLASAVKISPVIHVCARKYLDQYPFVCDNGNSMLAHVLRQHFSKKFEIKLRFADYVPEHLRLKGDKGEYHNMTYHVFILLTDKGSGEEFYLSIFDSVFDILDGEFKGKLIGIEGKTKFSQELIDWSLKNTKVTFFKIEGKKQLNEYLRNPGVILKVDPSIDIVVHGKFIEECTSQIAATSSPIDLTGKTIVTLSMEGNIPEFEGYDAQNANTKGGLGAYFGDKLEGLFEIGMKAYGIMPAYSKIKKDGQIINIDYKELINKGILQKVHAVDGKPLVLGVNVWDEDDYSNAYKNPLRKIHVFLVNRGGTPLFLLYSPKVLDLLYEGDRAHRFAQEVVFGKAAYGLMKELSLIPDILHLNEAHTVVAAAQVRADDVFKKTAIVYTNHTIVRAGLEMFYASGLRTDVNRMMYSIGLPEYNHEKFRSMFLRPDGVVDFCYAATHLADVINAVSDEHAIATKKLFKSMYGENFDIQVIGVLNGSGKTWKNDILRKLETEGAEISQEDIFNIHQKGKEEVFSEVEARTGIKLDPNKFTAWMVRRLAEYKSQYPMLRFLVHILCASVERTFTRDELRNIWFRDIPNLQADYNRELLEEVLNHMFEERNIVNGLGMQVVVGGPIVDGGAIFWASEFERWTKETEDLKGSFVHVPRSDARLLKMQAIGADNCSETPRPLEEACGTSGQRTALNGGVTLGINGAGPVELINDYNEETGAGNGFFIGDYTYAGEKGLEADTHKFYTEGPGDMLRKMEIMSRIFYTNKDKWKKLMFASYKNANIKVTAKAMEERYAQRVYGQAIKIRKEKLETSSPVLSSYQGKIKAIIFDFDGVIAKSIGVIGVAYTRVFFEIYKDINGKLPKDNELRNLIKLSRSLFKANIGMPTKNTLLKTIAILQGENKIRALRLGLEVQINNPRPVEKYLDSYNQEALRLIASKNTEDLLIDGADEVIKRLNRGGVLLYIASAGNLERVKSLKEKVLDALSLSDNFRKMVFTGSVDKKVEAIFGFLKELGMENIGLDEILFVDDSRSFIKKMRGFNEFAALPVVHFISEQEGVAIQLQFKNVISIRKLSDLLAVLPTSSPLGSLVNTYTSSSPISAQLVIDLASNQVIQRPSVTGKRILRKEGVTETMVLEGIANGTLKLISEKDFIELLDRSTTGIGISGGGDCAGIADFFRSLRHNLKPELTMLGVRNAGEGLMDENFLSKLILVDPLLAEDFLGQSSTPYGSSREDPLKKNKETTQRNLSGFKFFYGTGGNDHLGLLERFSRLLPELVVVGTFKSIDGDGWVAGRPAQMLGFYTATGVYQRQLWAITQNAYTHKQRHVVETFGRGCGKLAYASSRRYPDNFNTLSKEEQRKIIEFRDLVMIIVPEKPTSLRSIAEEAKRIKQEQGGVVVVVAEGFMPPELKSEIIRLGSDESLRDRWFRHDLPVESISSLIHKEGRESPTDDLSLMLQDPELAAQFAKTTWQSKFDPHGNATKLAGITNFIIKALEVLGGASKVNKILFNYEARGATPDAYDIHMGEKIGVVAAKLINDNTIGGKAVVYFEGMNPLKDEPVVVDLVGVSDKNNLNNSDLYTEEELIKNGVYWEKSSSPISQEKEASLWKFISDSKAMVYSGRPGQVKGIDGKIMELPVGTKVVMRVSKDLTPGLDMFLRHVILRIMDDYFLKEKIYTVNHIPLPLGYFGNQYYYVFVEGSEGWPTVLIDLDSPDYRKASVMMEEYHVFKGQLYSWGFDIWDIVETDGDAGQNIIHRGWDISQLYETFQLSKDWVLIDLDGLAFNKEKFFQAVKEIKGELKRDLDWQYELLMLAAGYIGTYPRTLFRGKIWRLKELAQRYLDEVVLSGILAGALVAMNSSSSPISAQLVIDLASNQVIQRPSVTGKRILRKEGVTETMVLEGIANGTLKLISEKDFIELLDRSTTGIGISGGGDCAGIADFFRSLRHNLKPELTMLGVRNAGEGLMDENFLSKLILVDPLLAEDFLGQSSTPYGSSREDPLKKNKETTQRNLSGFKFFYGTGGNDHLGLLERFSRLLPELVVVGTFKSIDGDGWVAGRPAQMLGFYTATGVYQRQLWAITQNAYTHKQRHVVETFGRGCGKLAYASSRRYPDNFNTLSKEEQRKIIEFRDLVMIIVPEKPTSLRSIAEEAKRIKQEQGGVVVVVAEGFMPPELKSEIIRLGSDESLRDRWFRHDLPVESISSLIHKEGRESPTDDLSLMLQDPELAAQFAKTTWQSKFDPHGNATKLAGITNFIIKALEVLGGASKVNKILFNYEARGATPDAYDIHMGEKIGVVAAKLINDNTIGGKAVVYFEGMNPLKDEPVVVDLVGVSDKNNLNNTDLYTEEDLIKNGVYWQKKASSPVGKTSEFLPGYLNPEGLAKLGVRVLVKHFLKDHYQYLIEYENEEIGMLEGQIEICEFSAPQTLDKQSYTLQIKSFFPNLTWGAKFGRTLLWYILTQRQDWQGRECVILSAQKKAISAFNKMPDLQPRFIQLDDVDGYRTHNIIFTVPRLTQKQQEVVDSFFNSIISGETSGLPKLQNLIKVNKELESGTSIEESLRVILGISENILRELKWFNEIDDREARKDVLNSLDMLNKSLDRAIEKHHRVSQKINSELIQVKQDIFILFNSLSGSMQKIMLRQYLDALHLAYFSYWNRKSSLSSSPVIYSSLGNEPLFEPYVMVRKGELLKLYAGVNKAVAAFYLSARPYQSLQEYIKFIEAHVNPKAGEISWAERFRNITVSVDRELAGLGGFSLKEQLDRMHEILIKSGLLEGAGWCCGLVAASLNRALRELGYLATELYIIKGIYLINGYTVSHLIDVIEDRNNTNNNLYIDFGVGESDWKGFVRSSSPVGSLVNTYTSNLPVNLYKAVKVFPGLKGARLLLKYRKERYKSGQSHLINKYPLHLGASFPISFWIQRLIRETVNPYWLDMQQRLEALRPYVDQIDARIINELKIPASVYECWDNLELFKKDESLYQGSIYKVRIRNNVVLGPGKGGIRFTSGSDLVNESSGLFTKTLESLNRLNAIEKEVRQFITKWIKEEANALALGMTLKNSQAGLDLGGGKGNVFIGELIKSNGKFILRDCENWRDPRNLARISRLHSRQLIRNKQVGIDLDIPAPDMNTTAKILSWYADEYIKYFMEETSEIKDGYPKLFEKLKSILDKGEYDITETPLLEQANLYSKMGNAFPFLGVYTGKPVIPIDLGGSLGRTEATGFGGVDVMRSMIDNLKGKTIAIQGFGNVGSYAALNLVREGAVIKYISDHTAVLYKEEGFSLEELTSMVAWSNNRPRTEALINYALAGKIKTELLGKYDISDWKIGLVGRANLIIGAPVDILILAALENQLRKDNVDIVKANMLVELANGPTTREAELKLQQRGIVVIHDTLTNAGGVIVSSLETKQAVTGEWFSVERVNQEKRRILEKAAQEVRETKDRFHTPSYRIAGDVNAVLRIANKKLMRILQVRIEELWRKALVKTARRLHLDTIKELVLVLNLLEDKNHYQIAHSILRYALAILITEELVNSNKGIINVWLFGNSAGNPEDIKLNSDIDFIIEVKTEQSRRDLYRYMQLINPILSNKFNILMQPCDLDIDNLIDIKDKIFLSEELIKGVGFSRVVGSSSYPCLRLYPGDNNSWVFASSPLFGPLWDKSTSRLPSVAGGNESFSQRPYFNAGNKNSSSSSPVENKLPAKELYEQAMFFLKKKDIARAGRIGLELAYKDPKLTFDLFLRLIESGDPKILEEVHKGAIRLFIADDVLGTELFKALNEARNKNTPASTSLNTKQSSSPITKLKLTGQEILILEEVIKEAIVGEFSGLFDRVVKNIADKFMITLSRERVRNALSDVRRKFGIKIDKTSVKGTRSTISKLPELILKAKEARLREFENVTEADIENIRAKESNPLNAEARKILVLILQGKSLKEIAGDMNYRDRWPIYRKVFYSVYGKIPEEVKGNPDNWRHSQLINAAKYALAQGWIMAGNTAGADKIISNPLTSREKSILEIAVSELRDTNTAIAGILNLKPHTVQVFVDEMADKLAIEKAGRNTLIECVKAGYEKGYISCDKDRYDAFVLRFYNSVRLNNVETGVLAYSALGFDPDKIALKLGINRRHITTNIYMAIRQKLGIKLELGQKMAKIMDEVIRIALKEKAISEGDILSAMWEEEKSSRLAIIGHILAKDYFIILNGVLKKLSKKLAAQQLGAKEESLVTPKVIVPGTLLKEEKVSLADTEDLENVQYEELPDITNSEFNKTEDEDAEIEMLRSYLAFKYPTREEQKILAEAIKNGKIPGADARAKARAKQAQDKLITGSMQRIIKRARHYKSRFTTGISLFDLSHEVIGYMISRLDTFDPDKGDFMAFVIGRTFPDLGMDTLEVQFTRTIISKGYINGTKLPADIYSRVKKVNVTIDLLKEESGGNDPTISQIADRLQVEKSTVDGVIKLKNGLARVISINEPVNHDDERGLEEVLGEETDILDKINLKGIEIDVKALIRKAIGRYNRYELRHHRKAGRITPLKELLLIQFLIEDKSFEEVRVMAEKQFGYKFNTKQNMSAAAWSVVKKLETKIKYNSLKPIFDFKKVEEKMGVPGLFGKISLKYNIKKQGKVVSSSPVYSADKTPLILNPIGKLIYGRVEELNDGHLDLFRDWDNHFWKSFGKLKHFDMDHVEILLRFQSNTFKTFVVITELPDFTYMLNSRLQREIKLVSRARQIQGALNIAITPKYIGFNLLEAAPWNQFSGNKFFSLSASGLIRFVYSNYVKNYKKYLVLRAPISLEAMNLYEKIFNKYNFKSTRPVNDLTGKFDLVIDKEDVVKFAAIFDRKYPVLPALTASSPVRSIILSGAKTRSKINSILSFVVKGKDSRQRIKALVGMLSANLSVDHFVTWPLKFYLSSAVYWYGSIEACILLTPVIFFSLGGIVRLFLFAAYKLIWRNSVHMTKFGLAVTFIPEIGNLAPIAYVLSNLAKEQLAEIIYFTKDVKKISALIETSVSKYTNASSKEIKILKAYSLSLAEKIYYHQDKKLKEYNYRRFKIRGTKDYSLERVFNLIKRQDLSDVFPAALRLRSWLFKKAFNINLPGYKKGTRPILIIEVDKERRAFRDKLIKTNTPAEFLSRIYYFDISKFAVELSKIKKSGLSADFNLDTFIKPMFILSSSPITYNRVLIPQLPRLDRRILHIYENIIISQERISRAIKILRLLKGEFYRQSVLSEYKKTEYSAVLTEVKTILGKMRGTKNKVAEACEIILARQEVDLILAGLKDGTTKAFFDSTSQAIDLLEARNERLSVKIKSIEERVKKVIPQLILLEPQVSYDPKLDKNKTSIVISQVSPLKVDTQGEIVYKFYGVAKKFKNKIKEELTELVKNYAHIAIVKIYYGDHKLAWFPQGREDLIQWLSKYYPRDNTFNTKEDQQLKAIYYSVIRRTRFDVFVNDSITSKFCSLKVIEGRDRKIKIEIENLASSPVNKIIDLELARMKLNELSDNWDKIALGNKNVLRDCRRPDEKVIEGFISGCKFINENIGIKFRNVDEFSAFLIQLNVIITKPTKEYDCARISRRNQDLGLLREKAARARKYARWFVRNYKDSLGCDSAYSLAAECFVKLTHLQPYDEAHKRTAYLLLNFVLLNLVNHYCVLNINIAHKYFMISDDIAFLLGGDPIPPLNIIREKRLTKLFAAFLSQNSQAARTISSSAIVSKSSSPIIFPTEKQTEFGQITGQVNFMGPIEKPFKLTYRKSVVVVFYAQNGKIYLAKINPETYRKDILGQWGNSACFDVEKIFNRETKALVSHIMKNSMPAEFVKEFLIFQGLLKDNIQIDSAPQGENEYVEDITLYVWPGKAVKTTYNIPQVFPYNIFKRPVRIVNRYWLDKGFIRLRASSAIKMLPDDYYTERIKEIIALRDFASVRISRQVRFVQDSLIYTKITFMLSGKDFIGTEPESIPVTEQRLKINSAQLSSLNEIIEKNGIKARLEDFVLIFIKGQESYYGVYNKYFFLDFGLLNESRKEELGRVLEQLLSQREHVLAGLGEDLVFELHDIRALHPSMRSDALREAMDRLAGEAGTVVSSPVARDQGQLHQESLLGSRLRKNGLTGIDYSLAFIKEEYRTVLTTGPPFISEI
ncbi:MAG: 6-phosphofructokinase, partial [Candidatus Omnitrophota bacterium]